MMKSMTYKIGPLEEHCQDNGKLESSKVSVIKVNEYEYSQNISDSDSIGKDFEESTAMSSDDANSLTPNNKENDDINEIVVIADSKSDSGKDHCDRLSNSDTASSNESGFGTVDDEIEHDKLENLKSEITKEAVVPIIVYQPLQQQQNGGYIKEISSSCSPNTSQPSDNISKYPQSIKLPTLQVFIL